MECQANNRLLDDLLTAVDDQRTIKKLFNLVHCSEIELMRLELQNYSAAVAFEILRIYLQESYESRPLVQRKTVGDVFGAFLGGGMDSQSRAILGVILDFYMRMQAQLTMEEHSELLATKISTLIFSPEAGDDPEGHGEGKTQGAQAVSDDDILWIMEVWTLLYPHLWPSEATLPPPSPTSTSMTATKSTSTSRLTRDSSVRSVDSVSSTAISTYTTTNASTVSAAIAGTPAVEDGAYERAFDTWPGEPPMVLKSTMKENDNAVHEAIGYNQKIEGLRRYIQDLRNTICEAFSRMVENKEERHLFREDLTKGYTEGDNDTIRSLSDSILPRDFATAIASVVEIDLEAGDDTGNSLRRCWSLGTLNKECTQPSVLRTLSLARNPQAIISSRSSSTSSLATISASRFSHGDEEATFKSGNLSVHGQLHQVLRTTKSQPSMEYANKQRDERPLPLTPVQQEQMRLRRDVSDIGVGAGAEEDGVSGGSDAETRSGDFEHPPSVATESSFENGASTICSPPPSPQEQQQVSQKQRVREMYLMVGRHLELLDECMETVEAQREEVSGKLDGMVARYEELVRQFVLATDYQIELERENEAIRELYDEVTEENNVIFERFNDELEGIFNAVNVPPVEQSEAKVEDKYCVEVLEDGETKEDELRRLLHKAIQDRTAAEQKARQATLQTNYYKDLLERHGIQADTTEIFQ
ncbi:hypothetical protein BGZ88_007595 [Linnemannia elongata]|nr:hypothetical protein BGZ88_007595 [Linnemannia elongata]